mgnify:CR=1 FL=1
MLLKIVIVVDTILVLALIGMLTMITINTVEQPMLMVFAFVAGSITTVWVNFIRTLFTYTGECDYCGMDRS